MTTLTSFSSLEISELEVKGLILSLLVNRSGTDVNLPGAGAQMKHSCQLLTSVPSLLMAVKVQRSRIYLSERPLGWTALEVLLPLLLLPFLARAREKRGEGKRRCQQARPREGKRSNRAPVRRTHRQKESLKEMSGESKGAAVEVRAEEEIKRRMDSRSVSFFFSLLAKLLKGKPHPIFWHILKMS